MNIFVIFRGFFFRFAFLWGGHCMQHLFSSNSWCLARYCCGAFFWLLCFCLAFPWSPLNESCVLVVVHFAAVLKTVLAAVSSGDLWTCIFDIFPSQCHGSWIVASAGYMLAAVTSDGDFSRGFLTLRAFNFISTLVAGGWFWCFRK